MGPECALRAGHGRGAPGGVTLHGIVAVYTERIAAEHAALRIGGVVDVANEIGLQPVVADDPDDEAIGEAFQRKLETHVELQQLTVQPAWRSAGSLGGDLETSARREEALHIARNVGGIRGLTDQLWARTDRPSAVVVRARIRQAFERHGCSTEHLPQVQLTGRVVTLVGQVPSDEERFLALEATRSVDGVHTVRNCLDVEPPAR